MKNFIRVCVTAAAVAAAVFTSSGISAAGDIGWPNTTTATAAGDIGWPNTTTAGDIGWPAATTTAA
jgi:hypothetical protein